VSAHTNPGYFKLQDFLHGSTVIQSVGSIFPTFDQPRGARIEPLEGRVLLSAGGVSGSTAVTAALPTGPISAAATPTPTASDTPVSGVPLGGNVSQQTAYVQDHAYVDLIKAATFKSLSGGTVPTDSLGWPLADFAAMVCDTDYGTTPVDPGVYNMSFTGPESTTVGLYQGPPTGKPQPVITKVGYNAATGTNTYTVTVPAGVPRLGFTFTNTDGDVKNLKVLQPGYNLSNYRSSPTNTSTCLQSLHPSTCGSWTSPTPTAT